MKTTSQIHIAPSLAGRRVSTFRRFTRARYAVFASLHREVRIGVLAISMLASVNIPKVEAARRTIIATDSTTIASADQELSEVTVAGAMSPLTVLQSARIVGVITRQQIESSAAQSVNDLLKLAVGVDVRQRGGFGIQTDISIDGGTFDQITLLLNGVNITSPQTGHLSADFPVSLSDIERIEILEGAASRVYGASAFGGAINIVTKGDSPPALPVREGANTHDRRYSVEAGVQGGMYGTVGADAHVSFHSRKAGSEVSTPSLSGRAGGGSSPSLTGQAGGGFSRSSGATVNSDFVKGNVFLSGRYDDEDFRVSGQAGYSQKSYGANTFYSAAYPNQYEQNRRFIMSVGAESKGRVRLHPEVYWHRLYDHFQLIRGTATGENYHRTDVHGARVTADIRWIAGRTAMGGEVREEGIYSSSLGQPITYTGPRIAGEESLYYTHHDARTNLSFNVEHTLLLPRFTLSAGALANKNTRFDHSFRFYPGIDLAYSPNNHWRLFASWGKGFRLPTFTDLYYKSPTHEGNQGMRAEESQSFQLGTKVNGLWKRNNSQFPNFNYQLAFIAFYHRGTNMIDWVMYAPDDVFHSANFDLDNMGVQANVTFNFAPATSLLQLPSHARPAGTLDPSRTGEGLEERPRGWAFNLSYAFIHQRRHDETYIYKSNYAMEYLRHKVVCTLDHPVISNLRASWALRWQQRMGSYLLYEDAQSTGRLVPYNPYATLDLRLRWQARHYELWADATNLLNRRYYDLGNVPQPGLVILVGVRIRFPN